MSPNCPASVLQLIHAQTSTGAMLLSRTTGVRSSSGLYQLMLTGHTWPWRLVLTWKGGYFNAKRESVDTPGANYLRFTDPYSKHYQRASVFKTPNTNSDGPLDFSPRQPVEGRTADSRPGATGRSPWIQETQAEVPRSSPWGWSI